MPRPPARATGRPRRPAAAAAAAALLLAALPGCPPIRDRVARDDVSSLQTNVQQLESVNRARQAGLIEQLRELREEQARLDKLLQDNQFQTRDLAKRVGQLAESTREELAQRDRLAEERERAAGARMDGIGKRIDALEKGVQESLRTLNDNLVAMSTFEKQQEARIAKAQEQVQGQLKVIVEEVGQANAGLERSIAGLRDELDAARQEAAATRGALGQLQQAMQQIADQLAETRGEVRELGRAQEALRRSAAAAPAEGVHVVRAGETLSSIATRYGVTVDAILQANRISDPDSINAGQKLAIPKP